MESKRELLKQKVLELVKIFVETEGGITMSDLNLLFGEPGLSGNKIASALAQLPVKFSV